LSASDCSFNHKLFFTTKKANCLDRGGFEKMRILILMICAAGLAKIFGKEKTALTFIVVSGVLLLGILGTIAYNTVF